MEMLSPGEPNLICNIWTGISRKLSEAFGQDAGPKSPAEFAAKRGIMDYRVMERSVGRPRGVTYLRSPISNHIAFTTPNAKANPSPSIQLKYHISDSFVS